jgi:hypothetical protein
MITRPQDVSQQDALEKMRALLRDFVTERIDVATFKKAFAFCFAPFDPLDYDRLDPGIDPSELATYIRISGGWFGEETDLIPFREGWTYGVDAEPFGWIDVPAFRAWIVTQAFEYLPDLNDKRPDVGCNHVVNGVGSEGAKQ